MGLVSEKTAAEIAGGVRAAKGAAADAIGEQMGRRRLRSGSKTRKSRATREKILTAASEIMAERGSTDFQMSEVSARCRMSKGALYYYFSDRDELVQEVFSSVGDELVAATEAIVADSSSAREALRSLCEEFVRRMRTKSPLVLAMTQQMSGPGSGVISLVGDQLWRIISVIQRQLELGKGEGFVDSAIDTRMASVYVVGGLVGTALVSAGGDFSNTDGMADILMGFAAHGLAPRTGVTGQSGECDGPADGTAPAEGPATAPAGGTAAPDGGPEADGSEPNGSESL